MSSAGAQNLIPGYTRWKKTVGIVMRGFGNRAALASLEMSEARAALAIAALVGGAAAGVLFLFGIALTFVVAAAFWDSPHRVAALVWLAIGELLVVGACVAWLVQWWRKWSPFGAIREQLEHDSACIREILDDE